MRWLAVTESVEINGRPEPKESHYFCWPWSLKVLGNKWIAFNTRYFLAAALPINLQERTINKVLTDSVKKNVLTQLLIQRLKPESKALVIKVCEHITDNVIVWLGLNSRTKPTERNALNNRLDTMTSRMKWVLWVFLFFLMHAFISLSNLCFYVNVFF